jgi:hypothetical protein
MNSAILSLQRAMQSNIRYDFEGRTGALEQIVIEPVAEQGT